MKQNYPASIAFVFKYEGGYTNNPSDPGGPTNFGITIADARKYWKPNATATDVRNMPKSVAVDIYKKHYADAVHFDDIASGLDFCTLDAGVNSGVGRSNKWLASAIGSRSLDYAQLATETKSVKDLPQAVKKYQSSRLSFLHGLRTWSVFGKGWGSRVAAGEALGVRLALESTEKPAGEIKKDLATQAASSVKNARTGSVLIPSGGVATTQVPVHDWSVLPRVGAYLVIGAALIWLGWWTVHQYHRYKAYKNEAARNTPSSNKSNRTKRGDSDSTGTDGNNMSLESTINVASTPLQ